MDNKLFKTQYNDAVLYITAQDLNKVMTGRIEEVVKQSYLYVQMDSWYSADYPDAADSEEEMLGFLCSQLFNVPPMMRERSSEDVLDIEAAVWLTYGELPQRLMQEAHEEGFDEDDDLRYLVFSTGTEEETFITSEGVVRCYNFWHGVCPVSNTAAQTVLDLHNDFWLVATVV